MGIHEEREAYSDFVESKYDEILNGDKMTKWNVMYEMVFDERIDCDEFFEHFEDEIKEYIGEDWRRL